MSDLDLAQSVTPTTNKPNMSADELLDSYDDVPATPPVLGKEAPLPQTAKPKIEKPDVDDETIAVDKKPLETKEPAKGPTIKARHGDSDVEYPLDAQFSGKVNDKEVKFTLEAATKAFLSQEEFNRGMQRRLTEVDLRNRKFDAKAAEAQGNLNKMLEAGKTGDISLFMRTAAKMAGRDPVEYEKETIPKLTADIEALARMTPEQRELYYLRRREQHLRGELDLRTRKEQEVSAIEDFKREVQQKRENFGISEEDFFDTFQHLKDSGKFQNPDEILPEHVFHHIGLQRHVDRVMTAIEKVDGNYVGNESFFDDISKLTIGHPGFSVEDISDIVREILQGSNKMTENLNQKVNGAISKGFIPSTGQVPSNGTMKELDDDMIEDLYRKQPVRRK